MVLGVWLGDYGDGCINHQKKSGLLPAQAYEKSAWRAQLKPYWFCIQHQLPA